MFCFRRPSIDTLRALVAAREAAYHRAEAVRSAVTKAYYSKDACTSMADVIWETNRTRDAWHRWKDAEGALSGALAREAVVRETARPFTFPLAQIARITHWRA